MYLLGVRHMFSMNPRLLYCMLLQMRASPSHGSYRGATSSPAAWKGTSATSGRSTARGTCKGRAGRPARGGGAGFSSRFECVKVFHLTGLRGVVSPQGAANLVCLAAISPRAWESLVCFAVVSPRGSTTLTYFDAVPPQGSTVQVCVYG